jgi:hypothetical protein
LEFLALILAALLVRVVRGALARLIRGHRDAGFEGWGFNSLVSVFVAFMFFLLGWQALGLRFDV